MKCKQRERERVELKEYSEACKGFEDQKPAVLKINLVLLNLQAFGYTD